LFPASFFFQNARLFAGLVACLGQPCQKQPSTNSASRTCLNTKSGRTVSRETRDERREPGNALPSTLDFRPSTVTRTSECLPNVWLWQKTSPVFFAKAVSILIKN
jgi:hypothetical protein